MKTNEINKYKINAQLGEGQFGKVYHAHDRALDQEKAIKVLDILDPTDFVAKLKEAEILNKCRHKHIVSINEANVFIFEGERKVVIDMEYISGGSLESLMKKKFISAKEVRKVFIDILFGLEHAHSKNILHRDIKPANIMIADDCAKLSDFGLAIMVEPTKHGSGFGYTAHFAPEMINENKTNIMTDVYAAGVTLFRAVNNINNWRDIISSIHDLEQVLRRGVLINRIGYNQYVPKKLIRIINKATNHDPEKRFQSASEFREALEKLTTNIDWAPISDDHWEGMDALGNNYCAYIINKSRSSVFEITKNSRRITNCCAIYNTLNDAQFSMYNSISTTTFL